ncbi:coxsackievirus and adenovirus receptor homolog [Entelurus aequoreus]|uniref:coxsackievirus and adenovirus receptor homolog n=1 Tax=Entelurus aequoreus TaxID=161455 RepID=UPI002B1E0564|nr:coxsackievirus and adenovirus receptor homolog [Entelurus aequoreus]XP_061882206.1 coxsackievirus and adenovirus receptor homolog [Entelurus aequoreus]
MMTSVLWYLVSVLAFCTTSLVCAFGTSANKTSYYAHKGSSVILHCKYTRPSGFLKCLGAVWDLESPKEEKKTILRMYHGQIHSDYKSLKDRINFTSPNPCDGDASIRINGLRMSDTGKYVCNLEFKSQHLLKTMTLTVTEELSTPVCAVQGKPVAGNVVTLQCTSSQGTPPLKYSWTKTSGNQMLPSNTNGDTSGGTLLVNRLSEDDCGSYRCTVESLDDTKHCEILLECPHPPSTTSDATEHKEVPPKCPRSPLATSDGNQVIIAVAATIVVLLLAIVLVLTVIWVLRKRNRGELAIN